MKRRLLYITVLASVMLASCSKEKQWDTLSDTGEKTPLQVGLTVQAGQNSAGTKAVDMTFENGDTFVAYLRHVTWDENPSHARALVEADKSPLLVTFTKGNTAMTAYSGSDITPIGTGVTLGMTSTNTKETADLTASPLLYWDDFSDSSTADKDLRTDKHYLESYYGYCYNGGTPSTALTNNSGVLGWTVAADQSASDAFQHSDLLWSAEQTPVRYKHTPDSRPSLILPFTHAMSKVTIEIVLDEGFDVDASGKAKAFGSNQTTPTLYANRVTATTAPTYTHSTTVAAGDARKIQMRLADDEATTQKTRVYEAVIAPTVMKNGNLLAQVTVDDNKYDINLTNAVLTTDPKSAGAAWSSKLNSYTGSTEIADAKGAYSAENGGITLPGVNYRIKVTLKKQKIDVVAYITDWFDVNASIDGTIMFDADVVTSTGAAGTEVTSTSFDLYRSLTNANAASYDADGDSDGIQKASTYTYNTGKWVGAPLLYWVNGSTPYYFRALAQVADPAGHPNVITSVSGNQAAAQGTDLLWAQTSAHTGKNASGADVKTYAAGEAINPRTGNVPLTFEHAMSKVSVLLKTDKDASGADIPTDARVNVNGAKITIINLYNGGTINVKTGDIESLTAPVAPADPCTILNQPVTLTDGVYGWRNNIVIPQSLIQDKEGADRSSAPTYYQSNELTAIYPTANPNYPGTENTSIGTGEATYYLTSELVVVPEVLFTDSDLAEINTHNAGLTGHKSEGDMKEAAKTKSEFTFAQFNEGKLHQNITSEQFEALPNEAKRKDPEVPDDLYTYDEYHALESLTEPLFTALPDALVVVPQVNYTQDEANAYNATLPGAWHVGDVKVPAHYKLPDGSITSHNAGELKAAGNKIMLYITLSDGTRYVIDLATCKDSGSQEITAWERGKHYTYTISLQKEQITFRAMIKDWVDKTGSGNANLEWD